MKETQEPVRKDGFLRFLCHGTFFFKMAKTLSARRGICKKSVWIGKMQGIFCLRMKRAG